MTNDTKEWKQGQFKHGCRKLSALLGMDHDLDSVYSDETLDAASTPIFSKCILSYTRIRELPVVTGLLKSELLLYPSVSALKNRELPLFTTQLNKLHFIKKNSPILTIYTHQEGTKYEYCKVFFKILLNNLTCYVFLFDSGERMIVFNNALKPHCDTIYKNTKLRIYGASGASSTFGNAAMKMYLLNGSSASLVDGMDFESLSEIRSIKDLSFSKYDKSSQLYSGVVNQKRNEVLKLLSQESTIAPVPFASFFDHGKEKIDGMKSQGTIRIFESSTEPEADMNDDTHILSAMMLTLVEQELVKMRGNKKPSMVNPSTQELRSSHQAHISPQPSQ